MSTTNKLSRGLKNNNPGNIRKSKTAWLGKKQKGTDPDFEQFETMAHGYRAMIMTLQNYSRKHGLQTIRGMVSRWAPPCENDTRRYIINVSAWTAISPDAVINVDDRRTMIKLACAFSRMENGVEANLSDVERGWSLI